jgi:enamine deaminase RidA (YjgF/YER057c/UK114 family)
MIEDKLNELGHVLPHPPIPVGSYVPVLRSGRWVVTSGQLPMVAGEVMFTGKVGHDLDVEAGQNAARLCVVNALAQIKACVGSLEAVTRIVRVDGFVQSAPGFHSQPQVLNGASELLQHVFGEIGRHTRVAVGVSELPLNAAVEIALWAEVRDE